MGNDGGAETCPRWSSLLGEDCTPGWGEWADHGHLTQKALCTWAIARVAGRDLLGWWRVGGILTLAQTQL